MRGFKRQNRKQQVREIMEKILSASGYNVSEGQIGLLRAQPTSYSVFYGDPPSHIGDFDYITTTLYVFGDSEQVIYDKPLFHIRETETGFWEIVQD